MFCDHIFEIKMDPIYFHNNVPNSAQFIRKMFVFLSKLHRQCHEFFFSLFFNPSLRSAAFHNLING